MNFRKIHNTWFHIEKCTCKVKSKLTNLNSHYILIKQHRRQTHINKKSKAITNLESEHGFVDKTLCVCVFSWLILVERESICTHAARFSLRIERQDHDLNRISLCMHATHSPANRQENG